MGMFSDLMGRIFGNDDEGKTESTPSSDEQPVEGEAPSTDAEVRRDLRKEARQEAREERREAARESAEEAAEEAPPSPTPISEVDVEAKLTAMEANHPEDLDWRRSIVDLMKLVGMDSSYGARKELALELGYTQAEIDSKGSAEMNMWLHKEVMKRLAENGGKVPSDLLS